MLEIKSYQPQPATRPRTTSTGWRPSHQQRRVVGDHETKPSPVQGPYLRERLISATYPQVHEDSGSQPVQASHIGAGHSYASTGRVPNSVTPLGV